MPTKKIAETWQARAYASCRHTEHNPPSMCVFAPGVYEHECPGCLQKQVFVVPPPPELG